jgi:hypothetical protein
VRGRDGIALMAIGEKKGKGGNSPIGSERERKSDRDF